MCPSSNAFESTITGNITVTDGSKTVTGVTTEANGAGVAATAFTTELKVGDEITFATDAGSLVTKIVEAIISNTSLQLERVPLR